MKRVAEFLRDARGNVTVMTAVALPVLMVLTGGAVDYARKLDARAKLQSATDAALLATMAHKRSNARISATRLQSYFMQELRRRVSERLAKKGISLGRARLQMAKDGTATVQVRAKVRTYFLRLAAINNFDLDVISQAKYSQSRTEVALVLDVTGSMAGSKLAELKRAATQFVNTISTKMRGRRPEDFRIAIVPFSQYVNVGLQYRRASWISVPPDGYRKKVRTYQLHLQALRAVSFWWDAVLMDRPPLSRLSCEMSLGGVKGWWFQARVQDGVHLEAPQGVPL